MTFTFLFRMHNIFNVALLLLIYVLVLSLLISYAISIFSILILALYRSVARSFSFFHCVFVCVVFNMQRSSFSSFCSKCSNKSKKKSFYLYLLILSNVKSNRLKPIRISILSFCGRQIDSDDKKNDDHTHTHRLQI